ncbi:MAG: hypothetical protein JW795_22955 [Chitinivibrionales bacterium]|nr:hypothetical protein [Chitinivibrionales bacterium]
MSSFLKDLAILLFATSEEIEKKSAEFKKKREERFKEFVQKMEEPKEEFLKKHEEEINKAKEKVTEIASKIGIATKAEFDELKTMIVDLNKKLDQLLNSK